MKISAQVVAHSVGYHKKSIVTLQLIYPRAIHGELLTHRDFSRSSMSSRAIPVAKMIEQVENDPWMPIHWGKTQPGMQAREELDPADKMLAIELWREAADQAAYYAERLNALGLHKQIANRVLEPFQWMRTVVTATEWDNFYELRRHTDAEPHFEALANCIWDAVEASTPVLRDGSSWAKLAWHLPYVTNEERASLSIFNLVRISAARCARVSYLNHDQTSPDVTKDLSLFERLAAGRPIHASPLEHQAVAGFGANDRSRNFRGWIQHRELYEAGVKADLPMKEIHLAATN